MTKHIAIIGTGISGLTCAYLLNKRHTITLFEANNYVGGHTATVDVELQGRHYAIDTGFIVYNDWTYPNFIKLMNQLGICGQPTEMSFSVKNTAQNIEYNGNSVNSLFAQRRNVLRPRFWGIIREILRFNKLCKHQYSHLATNEIPDITLGEFLIQHKFSNDFANNYILPMCAAIWSASLQDIKGFGLGFFLQFFNNHGLLNIINRPVWRTIKGGSREYIPPLTQHFATKIRLNTPVRSVTPTDTGIQVQTRHNDTHTFDEVIFACHSDQALQMLSQPTAAQRQILSGLPYAMNEVILHTDTSILPRRRRAWASWNYLLKDPQLQLTRPTSLTYNMNILQQIESPETFCVTLNSSSEIDPDKILRTFNYAHPQVSLQSIRAQSRRNEICGKSGIHFCGAYWYNGFHEDGINSALDVCARFGESL